MQDERAADVVRRFYKAAAEHDMDAAGACFAENALWVLPGRSPLAGRHRGWKAIHDDFLGQLQALSGGTFKVELMDVAVGDEYVVAVQHATAEHGGKRLDLTGCQLITVEDGKISEVRGHYSDQYGLDEFWSP